MVKVKVVLSAVRSRGAERDRLKADHQKPCMEGRKWRVYFEEKRVICVPCKDGGDKICLFLISKLVQCAG